MQIKTAIFTKSSAKLSQCPPMDIPEYAFIGRSNVGKSSLINALTNHSKLAKTSGKPGKTQLINHFLINDEWFLVDLPGYGFAKISKSIRENWEKLIMDYLFKRMNLINTFILVDSRHKPQKLDTELFEKYGMNQLPFTIVFTKTDKLTKNQLAKNIAFYKKYLLQQWEELPPIVISSAVDKKGLDEILQSINKTRINFDAKLVPKEDN
ncbi:MAG: YihA family ribosome biogenesis GTP-binding protein [Bacteroidetes bacterium]|nr:MAG: YihA family ribosome biogenesis GTP-binding protein [Bacteroidota bacterium]